MDEYDVVIVGAGCAGTSAGFFLKEHRPELNVLMLDRLEGRKFELYHRMCGEAVSEATFRRLGPLRAEHIVHHIAQVQEYWPGGGTMEIRAPGYILDRFKFLHAVQGRFLARGGELERDAVLSVEKSAAAYLLRCSSGRAIRSKHLIGADGVHSRVRKDIFRTEPPEVLWTEQYVVDMDIPKDTIRFIQGERYKGGYRWEFPAGKYAKVGFLRGTDIVEGEVIEKHRRAIPTGGLDRVTDGRCLLVGDAAAMPNPLTLGGIRPALLSGKVAAEAVLWDDAGMYEKWWRTSPYAAPMFMNAFRQFVSLTDQGYAEAYTGFGKGPLPLMFVRALMSKPKYRELYRAYFGSGLYGW